MKNNEEFFQQVYQVVRLIPPGRVTSYGAIAAFLGIKSGARMVGWAMNQAHGKAPAHRVVNRSGLLTGKKHFQYPEQMQELLEAEGVKVLNDQVVGFEAVFWDPEKNIGL